MQGRLKNDIYWRIEWFFFVFKDTLLMPMSAYCLRTAGVMLLMFGGNACASLDRDPCRMIQQMMVRYQAAANNQEREAILQQTLRTPNLQYGVEAAYVPNSKTKTIKSIKLTFDAFQCDSVLVIEKGEVSREFMAGLLLE